MAQGNNWRLDGNNNVASNSFLGSTTLQPLVFKTNNLERFRINADGTFKFTGLPGIGNGFLYTDANGLLQRLIFSGNANQVLLGNGTFGMPSAFNYFSQTSPTQLTTTYKLGLGVTNPNEKLEVNGNAIFNGSVTAQSINLADVSTSGKALFFKSSMCMDGYDPVLNTKNEICAMNAPLYLNSKPTFNQNTFLNANNSGKVGIGTVSPAAKLHVNGATKFENGPIQFTNFTDSLNKGDILVLDSNGFLKKGEIQVLAYAENNYKPCKDGNDGFTTPSALTWLNAPGKLYAMGECVPNPMVGIGIFPAATLHVKSNLLATKPILVISNTGAKILQLENSGLLRAREIKVDLATWPDYVFKKDYTLMPLQEVEAFIKTNGHLPNVPSAKEIEEEGLNLGETNKMLMEKVEELTLHLIAQQKAIDAQKIAFETQQKAIEALTKKINN